jgi:hypothetical protein
LIGRLGLDEVGVVDWDAVREPPWNNAPCPTSVIAVAGWMNLRQLQIIDYQTAQAFQDSLKSLRLLLVLAVLVSYIVLGVLYESYPQSDAAGN